MPKGVKQLSFKHENMLKKIRKDHETQVDARNRLRSEYYEEAERRYQESMQVYNHNLATSVWAAAQGGVPITVIAKRGLGHSGTNAVYDILKVMKEVDEATGSLTHHERFTVNLEEMKKWRDSGSTIMLIGFVTDERSPSWFHDQENSSVFGILQHEGSGLLMDVIVDLDDNLVDWHAAGSEEVETSRGRKILPTTISSKYGGTPELREELGAWIEENYRDWFEQAQVVNTKYYSPNYWDRQNGDHEVDFDDDIEEGWG